ncbi:MAG: alanine racemase [bacterium]|nr:alanine racemase [bacterium]
MNDYSLKALTKWCEIDLDLLAHNIVETKKIISKDTRIMAVIKDQAYGHGDVTIAHEMECLGIDFFAVSHIDEAIRLRNSGIESNILILTYTSPEAFGLLIQYHLTQALISFEYARKLNSFCKDNSCRCSAHVKVDTGMHRLGLCYDGTASTLKPLLELYRLPNLTITGTYTHFAVADSLIVSDKDYTLHQNQLFQKLLCKLKEEGISPGILHTQNTPATLHYPEFHYDYVRVGTLLMGLPYGDIALSSKAENFKPLFSLKAKVALVKTLPPNSKISYGLNYTTSSTEQIALVTIGYGDGYPRYLSNRKVCVIINDCLAEVIGNICMDQLLINVTDIPHVTEGDTVTLIGSSGDHTVSLNYIAQLMNTVSNELVDHINPRVPRVYRKGNEKVIRFLSF